MKQVIIEYWLEFLLTVISSGLALTCRKIYTAFKHKVEEVDCLKCGMRSLLRSEIIRIYNKYVEDDNHGYAPIYVKQSAEDAYNTYHSLGGNGTVTHLYHAIQELPTEKNAEITETQ